MIMPTRIIMEEYFKKLEHVLDPVNGRMSKIEYDERYSILELGLLENFITPQKFVDIFNQLLAMYQDSRKGLETLDYPREFI